MGVGNLLLEWFWTEAFWLPKGMTWEDFENFHNLPSVRELLYSIPLAFVYFVVQRGLKWFIFEPIAKLHGIGTIQQFPPENPLLEMAFKITHKPNSNLALIKKLAAELNWAENRVKQWFRQRDIAEKGGVSKKFKESGCRLIIHCSMSVYGFVCLWNKPWMWNIDLCWKNVYTTKIPDDIWWYYMLEMSIYVYHMVSHFTDVKRKDFWQMMCHHIFTLLMIGLSFVYNGFRIGSLILLCHDIADVPLAIFQEVPVWYFPVWYYPVTIYWYIGVICQLSKMLRYLKYYTGATLSFIVFVLVWFPSRLVYLPFVLIPSFNKHCNTYAGYICCTRYVLLYGLFVLHVIWSYMIIQVISRSFTKGQVEDVRSDSEDSD